MEEITVWKIEYEGSFYYEHYLGNIAEILHDMDYDSYYKITKVKIEKDKYKNFPEFTGF